MSLSIAAERARLDEQEQSIKATRKTIEAKAAAEAEDARRVAVNLATNEHRVILHRQLEISKRADAAVTAQLNKLLALQKTAEEKRQAFVDARGVAHQAVRAAGGNQDDADALLASYSEQRPECAYTEYLIPCSADQTYHAALSKLLGTSALGNTYLNLDKSPVLILTIRKNPENTAVKPMFEK
jgi:hypothetical protein